MDVTVVTAIFVLFVEECLCKETLPEQRNLPGRFYRQRLPVFVYSPDLLAMTVNTVLTHSFVMSGLT